MADDGELRSKTEAKIITECYASKNRSQKNCEQQWVHD